MIGGMADLPPETLSALYGVPPEEFVAARSVAVAEARARGDAGAAKSIAALRKPTVAAWMVNLAAHRRLDLIDELLEVGAELRQAQQTGQAARVRELSERRGRTTARLIHAIRDLVEQADRGGKLPEDELRATFFAAVADPQIGAAVRAGRIEKAVVYSGFGGLVAVPPDDDAAAKPDEGMGAASLAPKLSAAQDAEREARAAYEKAAREHTEALATLDDVDEQVAKLAARRTAASRAVDRAGELRARAEQALADTAARVKALRDNS